MRITQESDYAFRVILFLCKLGVGRKVEARVIADHEKIPIRFLLKLLRKMTAADLIKSYRGVGGGYELGKQPRDISLMDVIAAIEGPVCLNRCLYDKSLCNVDRTDSCQVHHALEGIQSRLIADLERTNFHDVMHQEA